VAEVYTHGHHDSVLRAHRWRTAANSAGYLIGRLGAGDRLLDVGCGPGTITADLAELVAPGRVVGVDASADPLPQARAEARRRGLTTVDYMMGDVYALAHPDGAFDVTHAHQVLQHLADPVAALRELRRVTRPGGLVAARDADYGAMVWYPGSAGLQEWRELYRAVARANGGEPDAGRRMLSWARAAGFDDIEPGASAWCYATPEERAWWSGLWAERTVESAPARRALEAGLATTADLARIAEAWREWGRAPDGWFAVPHGELLCRA
jgi:SAM-dependent methyltransferase